MSDGHRRAADAVVVGAGLSGLACALDPYRAGWRVILTEASDGVGGRMRTDWRDAAGPRVPGVQHLLPAGEAADGAAGPAIETVHRGRRRAHSERARPTRRSGQGAPCGGDAAAGASPAGPRPDRAGGTHGTGRRTARVRHSTMPGPLHRGCPVRGGTVGRRDRRNSAAVPVRCLPGGPAGDLRPVLPPRLAEHGPGARASPAGHRRCSGDWPGCTAPTRAAGIRWPPAPSTARCPRCLRPGRRAERPASAPGGTCGWATGRPAPCRVPWHRVRARRGRYERTWSRRGDARDEVVPGRIHGRPRSRSHGDRTEPPSVLRGDTWI